MIIAFIIPIVVIGLMAYKIVVLESLCKDLSAQNEKLLERNKILKKQYYRERTGQDDLYEGKFCPVCRSDSIRRIKYGIEGVSCVVYEWSKRFICWHCEYRWGLECKLMEVEKQRKKEQPIDSIK